MSQPSNPQTWGELGIEFFISNLFVFFNPQSEAPQEAIEHQLSSLLGSADEVWYELAGRAITQAIAECTGGACSSLAEVVSAYSRNKLPGLFHQILENASK